MSTGLRHKSKLATPEDKQVRVRRRSPSPLSPIVPTTPRRPGATPPPPAVIPPCRDSRSSAGCCGAEGARCPGPGS
ncbi:unnamed protein product [Rangifer tarandus platyrhynchus]|uniref:Uncharacterized protein n=2 Tax=Rangifer tarandus platyrhynchus TaxID=3082113 RepID=A0ABN8Y7C7_RANTA|nr:unnamed protein product [Rangifer tarandus platyrhynchus]